MAGNEYNSLVATPVHYYLAAGDFCHAAVVIASMNGSDTVTVRQLDGVNLGLPVLADHADVDHHESSDDNYNNGTWHYQGSCSNLS